MSSLKRHGYHSLDERLKQLDKSEKAYNRLPNQAKIQDFEMTVPAPDFDYRGCCDGQANDADSLSA